MNTPKAKRRLVSPSDERRRPASRPPGVAFAFVVAPAIRYGTAPRKGFVPLKCSVWFRAYVDIHTFNGIILIKSEEEPHNARGRQSIRFIL